MPGGDIIAELALGCAVGFTIGLTGIGGGALVVPALSLVLGLPATTAVGTASAYIFLSNIFASVQHWRGGSIDLRLANRVIAGALPGNIAACLAVGQAKRAAADAAALATLQSHLRVFIAGILALSILLMLANLIADLRSRTAAGPLPTPPRPPLPLPASLLLGALVGAVLGATSVGGGVILVPLLMLAFGLSARHTVGTSSYLALVLTLSTALLSAGRGDVRWPVAALMAVGSLLGVLAGIRLGRRLPETALRLLVVLLMLAAVGGMLLS